MVVSSKSGVTKAEGVFNIPVLYIVRCAQNQHGLRHGDYQRYQQYVTRRIRRMRKSLRFQQGTRSRVVPKKLTPELVTDARHLILSVFEIERCWACAMQLRSEANSEPRKRFHMISRLRKAAKSAQLLSEITAGVPMCDAQTKLELTAYIQWITGILHFEQQDWVKAEKLLESAQQIYTALASSVNEDLQAVYTARIEEILPQIRYCTYSIGSAPTLNVEGTLEDEQIGNLLKEMLALQAGSVIEVSWLGATIPVKLEKARLAVQSVQEADEQLAKIPSSHTKAALCESVVKVIVDALVAVREEIRSLSTSDIAPGIEKLPRLQHLYTYLQYLKLSKTIWRNLYQLETLISNAPSEHHHPSWYLLTSSCRNPYELARFYDTVVQKFQDVLSLPGGMQDNPDVRGLIKAKLLVYKSLRYYYMALTYFQGDRFLESFSLLRSCRAEAEEAEVIFSRNALLDTVEAEAVPGHPRAFLIQLLQDLKNQVDSEIPACKAGHMLELAASGAPRGSVDNVMDSGTVPKAVLKEPLIRSPFEFVPEKLIMGKLAKQPSPLVALLPDFEAIPVKPAFFDLALNQINFPSQPSKELTSAGIASFMKGLIWGQSKK